MNTKDTGICPAGCVKPGELTDDDLMAVAAGEPSGRAARHVRVCPACAALAATLSAQDERLRQVLFRFECPDPLQLGEYQAGAGGAGWRQQVGRHLALCPHCQAELQTITEFVTVSDRPLSEKALPAEGLDRRARRAAREALERIVAVLQVPTPALALRGGRQKPTTWRYTAADLHMTLHPLPADRPRGQMQLMGFAERDGAALDSLAGTTTRLLDLDGQVVAVATIDEIGNVVLGPVPPGTYRLELTLVEHVVVVPDLVLGEA